MTFNQINYFLAVADQLNFTRAASSLFVTQSTLSRSIAALEKELGTDLLVRDFHNVQLTPAGELMYREMKTAMSSINNIIRRVQVLGDADSNRFVLGILEGQSVEARVLFAIRSLSDIFPHLNVDIRRQHHRHLVENVKTAQLDMAQTIISNDTDLDPEIDYLPIKTLNHFLMAQKDDPIWAAPPTLASIAGRVLITPENPYPGLDVVNQSLTDAGIVTKVKQCPDTDTQALWLEAGIGVYISNEDSVIYTSRSFRPVDAAPLQELPEIREVLIWKRDHSRQLLDRFLSFIRSCSFPAQ